MALDAASSAQPTEVDSCEAASIDASLLTIPMLTWASGPLLRMAKSAAFSINRGLIGHSIPVIILAGCRVFPCDAVALDAFSHVGPFVDVLNSLKPRRNC